MSGHRSRPHHSRVTSIDVAREAQVSQATVSRAFATPDAVSDSARRRVLEAADRLGYAPNAIARTLSSRSSRMIGIVVPADSEFYEHALTLFARHLAPMDYQLLLFEYAIGTDIDRVTRAVRSYQLDALVVSAMIIAPDTAATLQEAGIPVVMFNFQSDDASIPQVTVDAEHGFRRLAEVLLDTGHSSVVFAGGRRNSAADQTRYRSASETLADAGVACRYVETGDFSYEAGYRAVPQILEGTILEGTILVGQILEAQIRDGQIVKEKRRPDAVMAASDSIAFGVMDGLRAAGLDVPGDISVTGFDGLPQAEWRAYDLTTIEQPMDDLVESAVELAIDGGRTADQAQHRIVPGVLRMRSTVGDRRNGAEQS